MIFIYPKTPKPQRLNPPWKVSALWLGSGFECHNVGDANSRTSTSRPDSALERKISLPMLVGTGLFFNVKIAPFLGIGLGIFF